MSLDTILADARVEYTKQANGRYRIVVPKADPKHIHVRLSDNPKGDIIHTLIHNPGCGIGYICRKTGIPRERANKILDELVKMKRVQCATVIKKSRSYKQYYPL